MCLALYTLGLLANRFIGFIYYNASTDLLKLAYLDFWGRRRETEIPAKDIIPVSEVETNFKDKIYIILRRYSTKDTFRISTRYGIILEKDIMKQLL